MNLYVGNLAFSTNSDDLREAFEAFGQVNDARVIEDRESGRSRGFGFVEMANSNEAQEAINKLNGNDLQGRSITVNEARAKEDRPKNNRSFSPRY